jgi:hypothetical protein
MQSLKIMVSEFLLWESAQHAGKRLKTERSQFSLLLLLRCLDLQGRHDTEEP